MSKAFEIDFHLRKILWY